MDKIILIGLGAYCIFMIYKNYKMSKESKESRNYVSAYQAIIKEQDNPYEKINESISKENNPVYKSGLYLVKAMYEIANDLDYKESLINFEPKLAFYKGDNFDATAFERNSDIFLWSSLFMAYGKKTKKKKYIDELMSKFEGLDVLKNTCEYQFLENVSLLFKGEKAPFLTKLIEGDYQGIPHTKSYLGFVKQASEAILDANGEELDEFYKEDLKVFSTYAYGKTLMKALGNYDKYSLKEETKEEEKK